MEEGKGRLIGGLFSPEKRRVAHTSACKHGTGRKKGQSAVASKMYPYLAIRCTLRPNGRSLERILYMCLSRPSRTHVSTLHENASLTRSISDTGSPSKRGTSNRYSVGVNLTSRLSTTNTLLSSFR